jgi:hypothetical protein
MGRSEPSGEIQTCRLSLPANHRQSIISILDGISATHNSKSYRLKLLEARGRRLHSEIDAETMRLKAEAPALETYESFKETLANKSKDKLHRHELRRALAALVENVVLDPHGKDGVWCFTVHLKGACEAVELSAKQNPKAGFIGLRPKDQARPREIAA